MIVRSLQSPPSASVLANLQVCAMLEVTSLSLFPDQYFDKPCPPKIETGKENQNPVFRG